MNGFSCKDPYCILSDVIWDELFEPAFAEMVSEQREIIDIPPEEAIDLSDGVELPPRSFLLRINRRRDL